MNTPTPAVKCEPTLETQHTSQDAQSVGELHAEYAAHGNVEDVKDEDYDVDDVEDEDPSSDESVASPIGSSAKATFMPEIPAHSMEVDANSPTQEPLEQEALSIAAHEASSVQMQTSDNGQNGPPLEERQAWILISTSNDPVHGYSRSAGPTWTSFSLARDAPIPAQLPGVGDLIFYNKGEKVVGVWRIAPGSDAKRIKADVLDDHMPLVKHLEIDVEWVKGAILGVEQLEPLHRVADGEQARALGQNFVATLLDVLSQSSAGLNRIEATPEHRTRPKRQGKEAVNYTETVVPINQEADIAHRASKRQFCGSGSMDGNAAGSGKSKVEEANRRGFVRHATGAASSSSGAQAGATPFLTTDSIFKCFAERGSRRLPLPFRLGTRLHPLPLAAAWHPATFLHPSAEQCGTSAFSCRVSRKQPAAASAARRLQSGGDSGSGCGDDGGGRGGRGGGGSAASTSGGGDKNAMKRLEQASSAQQHGRGTCTTGSSRRGTAARLGATLEPENWPADVIYTPVLLFGESDEAHAMQLACTESAPLKNVRIQPHPLFDLGLFATCDIPAGTYIGDYTGLVIRHKEKNESKYITEFDVTHANRAVTQLDIDAQKYGNETRMINHYFGLAGLADEPNVYFSPCVSSREHPRNGIAQQHVEVYSSKLIRKGEELLLSYGNQYWAAHQQAVLCVEVEITNEHTGEKLNRQAFVNEVAQLIIERLIRDKKIERSSDWRLFYKGATLPALEPISKSNVPKKSDMRLVKLKAEAMG
eukprot:6214470-Pleurochrysis_carterae.AAC.3